MAGTTEIFYLWYEDQFHYADQRESYAMAVCLNRAEAEAELQRRARPVGEGKDGYEIVGPCSLADEHRLGLVREVLHRIATGVPGPVSIPPELW